MVFRLRDPQRFGKLCYRVQLNQEKGEIIVVIP